jgi:broad specificity phosphatase PhoE
MVPGWHVDAMVARVDSFMQDARNLQEQTSLVVAHAHVIRLLTALWLGLEAPLARHFRLGTLGLVHLGWEREAPALLKWIA